MAEFTKKELLKIAALSSFHLDDNEIEWLEEQLLKTIEYTKQLEKVKTTEEHDAIKTINVFREDKAIQTDSSNLLELAPETEDGYFVVPKVLDQ